MRFKGKLPGVAVPAVLAAIILIGFMFFVSVNVKTMPLPQLPKVLQIILPQNSSTLPIVQDSQPVDQPPMVPNRIPPTTITLGTNIWHFEVGAGGWGNNQAQHYTNRPQNASIKPGKLTITALREDYSGSLFTSARLITRGSFEMKYGHLVFHDVLLPRGAGTWPALWLWPVGQAYSQGNVSGPGDKGLINGEIDILEYVGAAPNEANSSAHAYAHYPGHGERSGQMIIDDTKPHTYTLDWTPESLAFGIDGKTYYTVKNPHTGVADWPYDQPYFLIVNLAMGGDWGGMLKDRYPPFGVSNAYTSWQFSVGAITYTPL